MKPTFAGRSVLVTGAGGSIGSELCRLIMSDNAKRLILVSLTEAGLYNIQRRLEKEFRKYRDTEIVGVLGNAGHRGLMAEHLKGVDTVIHAGAHKHVPICEANPLAAITNNVLATSELMVAARAAGVEHFCLVSSDKAVKPASIMGATKRLAELLVAAQAGPTKFFTVRFGNVMDSAGSVLPLWREQLAAGDPITLTDERCERYFMSIPEAVALISQTIALSPSEGTFVFDMGKPVKLKVLAEQLIARAGSRAGIRIIGLRPGEKLTEELHFGGELEPTGVERVNRVREPARAPLDFGKFEYLKAAVIHRQHARAVELLWELVA